MPVRFERVAHVLYAPKNGYMITSMGVTDTQLENLMDHPSAPSYRVVTLTGVAGEIGALLYDALVAGEIGAHELDLALNGFIREAHERGEGR